MNAVNEQLSSLMDGEIGNDGLRFLLRRVARENEPCGHWERWQVARSVLRREEFVPVPAGFAAVVMARIGAEAAGARRVGVSAWLRWGGGGVVAATVAVAALMVAQPPVGGPDMARGNDMAEASPVAQRGPSQPQALASRSPSGHDLQVPLLAPRAPIETAPASFDTTILPYLGPMAAYPGQPYPDRGSNGTGQAARAAATPYVLLITPEADGGAPQPERARSHGH